MMIKRGRTWHYVTKVNGRKVFRSTGETDKRRAQTKAREFEDLAQLLRESPGNSLELSKTVVREVARIEAEVSTREAERVGQALGHFAEWIGPISLDRITTQHLANYQQQRFQRVCPKCRTIQPRDTCRTCEVPTRTRAARSTVQMEMLYILRLLRQYGFRLEKPRIAGRGRQTPNRPFTADELQRFFSHCPDGWRPLFLTLLCTGARPAEIVPSRQSGHTPLLAKEINPHDCTVTIRNAKRHAGSAVRKREIPVPRPLMDLLVESADINHPHVFGSPGIGLNHLFDRIIADAQIAKIDETGQKVTTHSFRHTYATMLHKAVHGDLSILQRALGHTQITTTMIYDHYQGTAQVIEVTPFLQALPAPAAAQKEGGGVAKRGSKNAETPCRETA